MDQSGQVQRITAVDTFVHYSGNNNTPHQTTNVCPAATSYNNIPLHLSLALWAAVQANGGGYANGVQECPDRTERDIDIHILCVRVNFSEHISGISFVLSYCIPSTFPVSTLGRISNEEEAFIGLMYAQIP
ncbi:unnamed protein product [Brugia pahangi]|uniref:Uncharacterized protein n=1 Tax=Brugia pahangi TaxID=6280 RepID=A0A0N4T0E7_BRUPA|nr:unnamed protein product [Brugia pahangi]